MVKLQHSQGRYFLSIPKDFVDKKKWKKGQRLIIAFNERGNLEIQEID